jgi:hypothetical protein
MDEKLSQQILDDLLPSLEALDTKTTALLQLLKDKGVATQEEMMAYLDQAANASNIRWRAARVRLDYLLSSAAKPQEEAAGKKSHQPAGNAEPVPQASEGSERKDQEKTNPEITATKPTADESAGTQQEKEKTTSEPTAKKERPNAKANAGEANTAAA